VANIGNGAALRVVMGVEWHLRCARLRAGDDEVELVRAFWSRGVLCNEVLLVAAHDVRLAQITHGMARCQGAVCPMEFFDIRLADEKGHQSVGWMRSEDGSPRTAQSVIQKWRELLPLVRSSSNLTGYRQWNFRNECWSGNPWFCFRQPIESLRRVS
jgi:hypothetical protein